uniref:Transmembrane protein n=1 Tax=Arabidopsis thaliana TaxID=3702 RepID=Q1PEI7_ARATH|nr:hypothetical protein At3g44470 [Arabidopsis thaliana]
MLRLRRLQILLLLILHLLLSTRGELAQKLDRGQDTIERRRLTQVPHEPHDLFSIRASSSVIRFYLTKPRARPRRKFTLSNNFFFDSTL